MKANAFQAGWGQTIFQSANEMANNAILRKKLVAITESIPAEKEWWEKRRESVTESFMRELDEEKAPTKKLEKPERQVAMKASTSVGLLPKSGSSDEDAVLVETPEQAGAAAGGAKGKKKKGKK